MGDRLGIAGERVAVAAAPLPGHREHLAGGQVAGRVVLARLELVADLVQLGGHAAGREQLGDPAPAGDDVEPAVARVPAAEPRVLGDRLARGRQHQPHRHARAVRRDRDRGAEPAAVSSRPAGVGHLAPPQREHRVEELGHLDVGHAAHRDAEQAAGVDAVGVRPGAVPARHRLHDDRQERGGLLAAFVEARDHRRVPGAAAGGLHVAAELQVAVEHLREAFGDQAAGEPRGPDRAPAHGGRERGVVERALLRDEVEAAHQTARRPRDVAREDRQQREHHAAAHARVGAVDDARLRVGAGEVERQVVAGLRGLDRDLVQVAVALVGLVLVAGGRPAAVGQARELRPQARLGVGHHPLHHGLDGVGAVLVDERVQPFAADVVGADLGPQVQPDQHGHAGAAHPEVGDVALQPAAAHHLDRRGGQRLGEHVLRRGRERPEADAAEVGLVGDGARPREQLAVVEDGLVDDHVVLVEAAADPRVVAQEHVALGDARVHRAVPQRPVDGEVDRPDEHGVVQPDLHLLAQLVGDGEVEVVGVGDDRRAGHALERLAHLVGHRPEPVAHHLVGERVEAVDLLLGDGVHGQRGRQRPGQLVRVDGTAGEQLRAGDRHGHGALRMVRLPRWSTVPVVPAGTTTVVVGTSTIAGPVRTWPVRKAP